MANETPGTVPQMAPRNMRVERQGSQSEPFVVHYPQVRGGICEFCGVLDRNVASEHQYKLCPHFRGMQLACSYCDAAKNPDDVVGHSVMNITEHPSQPGVLVACCASYECVKKHHERFQLNG